MKVFERWQASKPKMKRLLMLALVLFVIFPTTAYGGWFSWLFSLFRAESGAVMRAEARSVGSTFARSGSRTTTVEAARTVAAPVTRTVLRAPSAGAVSFVRSQTSGSQAAAFRFRMSSVSIPVSEVASARPQRILRGSAGSIPLAQKPEAAALAKQLNRGSSRVFIRSEKFEMKVGLTGKTHTWKGTVYEPPFTRIAPRNTGTPKYMARQFNTSERRVLYKQTTQQDFRIVRRYLKQKNR